MRRFCCAAAALIFLSEAKLQSWLRDKKSKSFRTSDFDFDGLVLVCMSSYDSESRLIFQHFSRSTRFTYFFPPFFFFQAVDPAFGSSLMGEPPGSALQGCPEKREKSRKNLSHYTTALLSRETLCLAGVPPFVFCAPLHRADLKISAKLVRNFDQNELKFISLQQKIDEFCHISANF